MLCPPSILRPTTRRAYCTGILRCPLSAKTMNATTATAADLPKLDPNDPSAKALLYVPDAKNVDTKNPMAARYAAGQTCATCQVIQGKDGEAYRPCAIFPGKLVAAAGWCSAWAKKA